MIEFLVIRGQRSTCIDERLLEAYGEGTVDLNNVRRWVRRIKEAETGEKLNEKPRNACPCTVVMFDSICRVDGLIRGDRRVATDDVCPALSVSKSRY
jgi:hypothetical protein